MSLLVTFFLHYLYQNLWPNVQQNWSNKNLWVHCSFVQIPIWWNWSYRCIILGLCIKLGKEFFENTYKNFCIFLVLEVQKNRSYQTSRIIGTNNVYKNTLYKYYVPPYHRRFDQKGGTIKTESQIAVVFWLEKLGKLRAPFFIHY